MDNIYEGYSFLQEYLVTSLLALGAYSTFKNMSQSALNAKMMNSLQREINKCDPRNKKLALSIVNRYSTQLTQIYNGKLDKKTLKKLGNAQSVIATYFYRPLTQIINGPDPNWKREVQLYLQSNVTKINRSQNTANMISLAAIGTGAAGVAGVTAAGTVGLGLFGLNVVKSQLSHFNSLFYLRKMGKELEACNDRQTATKIVDKYCYQIANDLQQIVIKSGKKVPLNIQLELRSRLGGPLISIINNQQNKYWKILAVDYLKSYKSQQNIQYVCNTISQLIMPAAMSKFLGSGSNSTGK